MKAQIVRWGNSLAIRIPKRITEQASLREGDYLELDASEGQVHLRRARKRNVPTLESLVEQITPENHYPEISTGHAVGKEEIEW